MLNKSQKEIVNTAVKNIKDGIFHIHEIPTGAGKSSYILPHLAKILVEDKKVIISTFTNFLAQELFENVKRVCPDCNVGLVMGAKNYLDLKKIDEDFYEYFIYPNKAQDYISKRTDDIILFTELFDNCLISEDDQQTVRDEYRADDRKDLNNICDYDISITNQVYLLAHCQKLTKSDLSDYYFLYDEFDRLYDAQKILSAKSFSIYRFKTSLQKFIKTGKISIKDKKYLSKIYAEAAKIMNKHKNTSMIGGEHLSSDSDNFRAYLRDLSLFAGKRRKFMSLVENYRNNRDVDRFQQEYKELNAILNDEANATMHYAPVYGYPSIQYLNKSIRVTLMNSVYPKLANGLIGISGTIYSVPKPSGKNAYKEKVIDNGTYFKNKMGLNNIENIKMYSQGSIFPKHNVKIHTDYTLLKNNEYENDLVWAGSISEHIAKTYGGKNSLVIAGSYAEVKDIYNKLKTLLPDEKIIYANLDMTQSQTVNKFKEDGGILIGTRTYATGVNLPGKEIENLYIAKLLFPVIGSKDMVDMKNFNEAVYWSMVYNDMYAMSRQALGRLQRTEKDSGDIYVLDARINDKKIKGNINLIFKSVGILI